MTRSPTVFGARATDAITGRSIWAALRHGFSGEGVILGVEVVQLPQRSRTAPVGPE